MKYPDGKLHAAATLRKSALCSSLLLAGIVAGTSAQAAAPSLLPTGSVLMFQAGTSKTVTTTSGAKTTEVTGGSWFGMDMNGDQKISPGERTAIAPDLGLPIGVLAPASNSHTGAPNGSENTTIDQPWEFFSNTGMDFLNVPATLVSGTAPNFILDLSGWNVTWNGISAIPMGTNAWTPLNCNALPDCSGTYSNGQAHLTWDGISGDSFQLTYGATVPAGSPSGFGGVRYWLYLTGNVYVPPALTSSTGTPIPMTIGSYTFTSTRIGDTDLAAAGIPADPDTNVHYPIPLYYDFTVPAGSGSAEVVIPLSAPLPDNAVWRTYNPNTGTWANFVVDATDSISSAPGSLGGTCPVAGSTSYSPGLTAGNFCVELSILQGGNDDTDSSTNTISDPGGVATSTALATAQVDTRTYGTSGCSISPTPVNPFKRSDWFLLLGFVAWLGFRRRRRHH